MKIAAVAKRAFIIIRQLLVCFVIYQIALTTVPVFAADVVVDANAQPANKPTVDKAQNGVTVVNIAAPTKGGVSHNKFERYNVGSDGIVINNSKEVGVSVLGGAIYGNPNLQGKSEAKIILNEVTGTTKSTLNGYTEVFGRSADFILANPNGIVCNGAGFINTPRVTLTTGVPNMENGYLRGFDVQGGDISIEGAGIDAGSVDYFALITRLAALGASVWGKDVSITTGTGFYDYNNKTFAQSDVAGVKPEFGIDASAFGSIYAGRITIVSNENGVGVRSVGSMIADAGDIRITANGDIVLKDIQTAQNAGVIASGTITQTGGAFAMGNIDYTASVIANRGSITAANDISLTGHIDNNGGTVASSGNIDIETTGTLENTSGTIATGSTMGTIAIHGSGDLTVDGGQISSAGNVAVDTTGDFTVAGNVETIYAGNNLSVDARNITNNAAITAEGNTDINASENISNTASGSIASGNTSTIDAVGTIINDGLITSSSNLTIQADTITNTNEMAEISSGNALTMNADTITNSGGLLFGLNDLDITARSLDNERGYIYSMGDMTLKGKTGEQSSVYNYSGNIESEGNLTIDVGNDGKITNTGEDTGSYTTRLVHVGDIDDWCEWYLTDERQITSNTMKTESGFLISDGNILMTAGEVKNHGSVISAANDITINANTLTNETNSKMVYFSDFHVYKWTNGWGSRDTRLEGGTITVVSADKGLIKAGGTVTINATTVSNGLAAGKIESGSTSAGITTGQTGNTNLSAGIDLSEYMNLGANGNALFNVNNDPDFTYLIETRNKYIDVDKLYGSQYFLEQIGYDPDGLRFLGDAYYEQQLVMKGILKATSERYLDESIKSDNDQMAWLIENAASAYRDLHLTLGVALTKEQINELQQPVIWYVEKTVMGVKVLSPTVYIPEHILEGFSNNNKSTIAGNNVIINAKDQISNSGDIRGNNVNLTAQNDIINRGGTIRGEDSVSLTTVKGDIINETMVQSSKSKFMGNIESSLGPVASIESGGTLTIHAGNDFTNKGANVSSIGNATIAAGGDISFETVRVRNRLKSGNVLTDNTKVVGSTLAVGGDLSISSGGDTTFIGSNADITGNADVHTGGNFNLINDYDTTYYKKTETDSGMFSSSTTVTVRSTKTVVGSGFKTGGDLNVASGNDINIVGSSVTSGGNATMNAEGTQNIVAVQDESYYKKETKKSGLGVGSGLWGSKTTTDDETNRNAVGSVVDIKNKYASKSGKDTNITGSSITASEAQIETGGDLNIKAAYDYHEENHITTTTSVMSGSKAAKLTVDAEGNTSTKAVGSTINTGKLTIKSGNDVLVQGSAINAGVADIQTAGSFIETSAKEESTSYSYHKEIEVRAGDVLKDIGKDIGKAIVTGGVSALKDKGGLEFERGRLSATVAEAHYLEEKTNTETTTQASSEVTVNDTLNINSGKDIVIAGSNLNVGGDASLTAAGDVRIETTSESTKTTTEKVEGTAELTVGVKHQATEVAYAGKELKDAYDKLKEIKASYEKFQDQLDKAKDDYKKGLITRAELDDIEADEKYYKMAVGLAAENVAVKTAALTQQIAALGGSAKTYGFNPDVQLTIDALIEKSMSITTTAKGSNVGVGGNLAIKSGNLTKIEGSAIQSNGDISIDAKDVEILAAANTTNSSSDRKHGTVTMTMSSGGYSANASADVTMSGSESTSWTNSYLLGKNISIKSGNDTTVGGGVVRADEKLALDVGGNLVVESRQDTSRSRSVTIGVSGGGSSSSNSDGSSNSSVNAGANFNLSKSNSRWVNEQTSLTGGGEVDINVANKTSLTGAVIASDTKELSLTTGSFEYKDLHDRNYSMNAGGGIGISLSFTTNAPETTPYGVEINRPAGNNESSLFSTGMGLGYESKGANGSSTLNMSADSASFGFSDKRQTNFATVGEGAISTGDGTDISKLNRDTTVAQYGTMDTGVQLQLDKDMLQIVDTAKKTADSAVQVYGYAKETLEKATNLIESGHFTTDDKIGYYLDMDKINDKKEKGEPLTPQEKIAYYDAKMKAGEPLSMEDNNEVYGAIYLADREKTDECIAKAKNSFRYGTEEEYLADMAKLKEQNPEAAAALAARNSKLYNTDQQIAALKDERAAEAYQSSYAVQGGNAYTTGLNPTEAEVNAQFNKQIDELSTVQSAAVDRVNQVWEKLEEQYPGAEFQDRKRLYDAGVRNAFGTELQEADNALAQADHPLNADLVNVKGKCEVKAVQGTLITKEEFVNYAKDNADAKANVEPIYAVIIAGVGYYGNSGGVRSGGSEIIKSEEGTSGSAAVAGAGKTVYRAIPEKYAQSTVDTGEFYKSGGEGRLGNDGIYANSTIEGAIKEFEAHNILGEKPVVFELTLPNNPTLKINPPSRYYNEPLPFTQDVKILEAPSIRLPGTTNYLIREGAVPGEIVK